jgi:hypothetical protein
LIGDKREVPVQNIQTRTGSDVDLACDSFPKVLEGGKSSTYYVEARLVVCGQFRLTKDICKTLTYFTLGTCFHKFLIDACSFSTLLSFLSTLHASKAYKESRANIGFRYNLFHHLGTISTFRSSFVFLTETVHSVKSEIFDLL